MQLKNTNPLIVRLLTVFNTLDSRERVFASHYDLEDMCIEVGANVSADEWRTFLLDEEVKVQLNLELRVFAEAETKKIIKDASLNQKSNGAAAMLNALDKINDKNDVSKSGTILIYTHVPLTEDQLRGIDSAHVRSAIEHDLVMDKPVARNGLIISEED